MLFLRRLLSLFLFVLALGFIGIFAALFSVRYFGERGEVSQVFHLTKSVALGGGNYINTYNVAVTPKEKIAQICDVMAWTSTPKADLLDHQVWLWPVEDPVFAYEESPKSRLLMWVSLGAGAFLPVLAFFFWKKQE